MDVPDVPGMDVPGMDVAILLEHMDVAILLEHMDVAILLDAHDRHGRNLTTNIDHMQPFDFSICLDHP